MTDPGYPFGALVGADRLQLALVLCAVRPDIGGVLIRGEKGTAKSTAVRGLAVVLAQADSAARLVELPIGATEDRVVGALDLARVLRDGEHAFAPGLLARADRGVLYVDEVNLLGDHLVDVLLDAAAMGRVHVERDGVSHTYPSRFVLVGTMNPEEGELRPQLLDRFGLTVEVAASRDVDVRVEVIRRRLAYDADPAGFAAQYAGHDTALAGRVVAARALAADVALPDAQVRRIAALCAAFDVDGMRADLVVARTAMAHAAWRATGDVTGASAATGDATGARAEVTEDDIRVAAELALPHRRRRDPFDDPGLDPGRLDEALRDTAPDPGSGQSPAPDGDPDGPDSPPDGPDPSPDGAGSEPPAQQPSGSAPPSTRPSAAPSAPFRTRTLTVPGLGEGAPGRRSRARTRTGATVAATADSGAGVHLFGTLLTAAGRHRGPERVTVTAADVRRPVRRGREGNLVVFAVDASGSMAARDRMAAVGGATLSLLRDAYQRRDQVAVISFRGAGATVLLPPTASVHAASVRLATFDTGGKTPVAYGLLAARDLVLRERVRDRTRRPLVVVLTDGRATGGPDPVGRALAAAGRLRAEGTAAIVVDCETGYLRLGLAGELATALGAPSIRLDDLRAESLTRLVTGRAAA